MLSEYPIELNALTPIWTGGANRSASDKALETGILGSLRWWTELLVRSLGVDVPPDPVGDTDSPVAKIFGSTSCQRSFGFRVKDCMSVHENMELVDGSQRLTYELTDVTGGPARSRSAKAGIHPSWFFEGQPRSGLLTLVLTRASPQVCNILHAVATIASLWGGLGAKSSFGCGRIHTVTQPANWNATADWLLDVFRYQQNRVRAGLPMLQSLFRAQFLVSSRLLGKEGDVIRDETPFRLRYRIREAYRIARISPIERHRACGWLRNEDIGAAAVATNEQACGSVFAISFPYATAVGDEIRIWGWRPDDIEKARLIQMIRSGVTACYPSLTDISFKQPVTFTPAIPEQIVGLLEGAEADV